MTGGGNEENVLIKIVHFVSFEFSFSHSHLLHCLHCILYCVCYAMLRLLLPFSSSRRILAPLISHIYTTCSIVRACACVCRVVYAGKLLNCRLPECLRLPLCHQPHYCLFFSYSIIIITVRIDKVYVHCLLMYNLIRFCSCQFLTSKYISINKIILLFGIFAQVHSLSPHPHLLSLPLSVSHLRSTSFQG